MYDWVYVNKENPKRFIFHKGDVDVFDLTDGSRYKVVPYDSGIDYQDVQYDFSTSSFVGLIKSDTEVRQDFKASREQLIASLTVEVDGMVFDADEVSRSRMADTVVGLDPLETHLWVLADNSVQYLTREKLREVLRGIGIAQTNVWVQE